MLGGGNISNADPVSLASTDYTVPSGNVTLWLWVGTAGNLYADMAGQGGALGGLNVPFPNLTVGWHPLQVVKIRKTSTTAGNIVACW